VDAEQSSSSGFSANPARTTAKAVHEQLRANTAGEGRHVPAERTVHDILNRLGYLPPFALRQA
jgi:hypothetical protein